AERPAGMGLFSVFKLGRLAEVRSGRWHLSTDFKAMCAGKLAVYEGMLPNVKGTQVKVSALVHDFCSEHMPHAQGYAERWEREAEFMPFRTTIVVDGAAKVIEPFNPLAVPAGALRINTAWGFIDIHTVTPERGDSSEITLIQQGIAAELKGVPRFGHYADSPWVRLHARPGTVNFTLPDRDAVLDDAQQRAMVKEVKQAGVDAVVSRITEFGDNDARRRLAGLVYAWDTLRVVELPADLQHLRVRMDAEYTQKMTRKEIAAAIAAGKLACSFEPTYHSAFDLVPAELLLLPESEVPLFKAMFPNVPVINEIEFAITADSRSAMLWRAGAITLKFDSGETRVVQPVTGQTVLANADLEAEFVPNMRRDSESGVEFAVVHSCAGAVACPNLDPWYQSLEENMDHEQAEELWRTSDYAVAIAATWPGVPANDITPDELVTLLRARFNLGRDSSLRFTNATFEIDWGNRLSIGAATVEVIDEGEVSQTVNLREIDGYLREPKG
ncbi:MAG: hypothetical protein KBG84_15670, partial [Planctomycetes bacterium]|nr:hypothetical protein [Planctomycetota bacterium]